MCTVSIVATDDRVRIVCNRDEQRRRPPAIPPLVHIGPTQRALFPVDPEGGGTWIGVNDAHLAIALLNRNDGLRRPGWRLPSRGRIVSDLLLRASSIGDALQYVSEIGAFDYAGYRLVMFHDGQMAVVRGGGGIATVVRRYSAQLPRVFSSSSLGDALVEGPRQRLFTELLATHHDPFVAQGLFHRHTWPEHRDVSVVMSRADARTVSRVEINFRPDATSLRYETVEEPLSQPYEEARAC